MIELFLVFTLGAIFGVVVVCGLVTADNEDNNKNNSDSK